MNVAAQKTLKRIARIGTWSIAVLMALFVFAQIAFWGGIVWLNSKGGQSFIQTALGGQLEESGYRVEIGGFSYIFPTLMRLGSVNVYKGDEAFLSAQSLRLDLDMFPLEHETLGIDFNIGEMTLYAVKNDKKAQTYGPATSIFPVVLEPFDLPDIFFKRLDISDIAIDKLTVKGQEDIVLSPRLTGSVILKNSRLADFGLVLKDRGDKAPGFLPRTINIDARFNSKSANLEIEAIKAEAPLFSVNTDASAVFRENGDIRADIIVHPKDVSGLSPVTFMVRAKNTSGFTSAVEVKGQYLEQDIALNTALSFPASAIVFNDINILAPEVNAAGRIVYDTASSQVNGKLSGRLNGLSAYQAFIGTGHMLEKADFDFDINGNDLQIKVHAKSYANKGLNVAVKDVRLDADLSDKMVQVNALSMRDDEDGRFNGSGSFNMKDQSVDFSMKADTFHALKGDMVDGKINADVAISGNAERYKINGTIAPQKVEIKIPERFSSGIPQLHIEKKGKPKTSKAKNFGKNIDLDMIVDAPRQVLVRGWGLDAEFGGKLEIKGTANDPKFYGNFDVLRGRYSEFGKKFKIAKAKMKFSGSIPPSPVLDILTETKAGDIIAKVAITGSVMKPEIGFSSEPALPQDEVMSKILFGEDLENISPFQAVQLAQTMQRFSGTGGGGSAFDPLGSIRSASGLDDLRVETDDQGQATVGAGKYLSEKVYLEFETGTEEDSGNANVQVELTPNITLESEIGQDASGGAGLFWKWDY